MLSSAISIHKIDENDELLKLEKTENLAKSFPEK